MNNSIFIRIICAVLIAMYAFSTSEFNIYEKIVFSCGISIFTFIKVWVIQRVVKIYKSQKKINKTYIKKKTLLQNE